MMFICFSLETWDQQISSLGKFFWKLQLWWRHFLSLSYFLLWHWSYQWCICLLSITFIVQLWSNVVIHYEYGNTSDTHNPKCIYICSWYQSGYCKLSYYISSSHKIFMKPAFYLCGVALLSSANWFDEFCWFIVERT